MAVLPPHTASKSLPSYVESMASPTPNLSISTSDLKPVGSSNLSIISIRATALDVCYSVYGETPMSMDAIDRFYETSASKLYKQLNPVIPVNVHPQCEYGNEHRRITLIRSFKLRKPFHYSHFTLRNIGYPQTVTTAELSRRPQASCNVLHALWTAPPQSGVPRAGIGRSAFPGTACME